MRRILRSCLLAAAFVFITASPAIAAMWLRIEVAEPVVAGVPAAVTVTTLVMYSQGCVGDPSASSAPNGVWYSYGSAAPTEPAFKLVAQPAGGPDDAMPIALIHRGHESPYWDGSVTFPAAGTWTVRMIEPVWGDERCAGARLDVTVASGAREPSPQPVVALIGFAILGVGVGIAARRLA